MSKEDQLAGTPGALPRKFHEEGEGRNIYQWREMRRSELGQITNVDERSRLLGNRVHGATSYLPMTTTAAEEFRRYPIDEGKDGVDDFHKVNGEFTKYINRANVLNANLKSTGHGDA